MSVDANAWFEWILGPLALDPGADPEFCQGWGAQVLRTKVADIVKQNHTSEASNLQWGSRAHLRALDDFGFLMLKYALVTMQPISDDI